MRVFFYHTQDIKFIHKEWSEGRFPAHFLYGATHLPQEGIDVVFYKYIDRHVPRFLRMIYNAWQILTCHEKIDAVYATRHNGIEIIILLRALGLYRKPIVCWHHQPVENSGNPLKERIARFFYRGIDHMFFFSDYLKNRSLASGRITTSGTEQCAWGADMDFYNRLMNNNPCTNHEGFISTGKENRDMPTLVEAFAGTPDQHLDLFSTADSGGVNYEQVFSTTSIPSNVTVNINHGKKHLMNELAHEIWTHKAICICCKETNYTVGLTTLVEALAFGLPVIISKNPNQPFDASEEGCGISVPYGDTDGWRKAIRFIADNPDEAERMGRRAHEMSEQTYNISHTAHIIAEALKKVNNDKA